MYSQQGEYANNVENDFLRYEDPRITEMAKGYAMQAAFYSLTGEPFCDDPRCRLFNAHWQREMFNAQLGGGDYCPFHRNILELWSSSSGVLEHSGG